MDWTLTTVLLYYNHIIINHQSTIVLTGYNRLSYMYIDHQDVYIYILQVICIYSMVMLLTTMIYLYVYIYM